MSEIHISLSEFCRKYAVSVKKLQLPALHTFLTHDTAVPVPVTSTVLLVPVVVTGMCVIQTLLYHISIEYQQLKQHRNCYNVHQLLAPAPKIGTVSQSITFTANHHKM